MNPDRKAQIADRFADYPALNMLVRLLLFGRWFRIFFVGFFVLIGGLVLFVSRIWQSTPPDVSPVIKVSLLDFFQARALERSALDELQRREFQSGLRTYLHAVANNPGDIALVRRCLEQFLAHARPPHLQVEAANHAVWLLRLSKSDPAGQLLAAQILYKYQLPDALLSVLRQIEPLAPELEQLRLRALFDTEQIEEFDRCRRRLSPDSPMLSDPELSLYFAAHDYGSKNRIPALELLEKAAGDPAQRTLALRLLLSVQTRLGRTDACLKLLDELERSGHDRIADHIRVWLLLAASNRKSEATEHATRRPIIPRTALETAQLAQAYFQLGLRDEAIALLDRFSVEFSYFTGLWTRYADLLVRAERWDELRELAISIRIAPALSGQLDTYSHFLDGLADLHQQRYDKTRGPFARLAECRERNPELAILIAENLLDLGFPRDARALLAGIESPDDAPIEYWNLLLEAAYELKDPKLLLEAATAAHALDPEFERTGWTAANNYAAALLVNEHDPERAVRLTFSLFQKFPQILSVRLNHAMALTRNGRASEADRLLATIDASAFNPQEQAVYYFACMEATLAQSRLELAKAFAERIDSSLLFPHQSEIVERVRQGSDTREAGSLTQNITD